MTVEPVPGDHGGIDSEGGRRRARFTLRRNSETTPPIRYLARCQNRPSAIAPRKRPAVSLQHGTGDVGPTGSE